MATTKQEALKRVTADDEARMRTLRKQIEEALLKYDGGTVSVTPSVCKRVNDKIAEEYRNAGWIVEYGHDQRDGAWMSLK